MRKVYPWKKYLQADRADVFGTHFIALVSRQDITNRFRAVSDGPFSMTYTTPSSAASTASITVISTSRILRITQAARLFFFFLNRGLLRGLSSETML